MAFGYLNFLFGDVSAYFYQLHAVEQGARNGIEVVGGGDEEHFRQVVVYVQVVVVEGEVLLRVEHFEQCRGWVTVDCVLRHLVNLVEDEHGVGRAGLLYALYYAARHSSYVRAPVASYLGFVVHTAERNPCVFALHGGGYALAEARLAYARGAV